MSSIHYTDFLETSYDEVVKNLVEFESTLKNQSTSHLTVEEKMEFDKAMEIFRKTLIDLADPHRPLQILP